MRDQEAPRPNPPVWLKRLWPINGASNALPALDGVRGVAVLLVMLYHAWHITPNMAPVNEYLYPLFWTRTGVHLFFVLSGFLLFTPYVEWIFGLRSKPSTGRFYFRRALRVGPAYWACLAILGLAASLTTYRVVDVLIHSTFLFNLVPASLFSINGVFWTMAVEVQFYVLLPLIAMCAYLVARRGGPLVALGALFAGLATVSILSGFLGNRFDPLATHPIFTALFGKWSVTFFLGVFGAGAAVAAIYVYFTRIANFKGRDAALVRSYAAAGFVVGVLLAVGLALAAPIETRYSFGKNIFFGIAYGLIVGGVALGPRALRAPFEWPALRFVGLISYSLYLWHAVVYSAVSGLLAGVSNQSERFLMGIGLELIVAVPVAYVSYQLAERPFMVVRAGMRDKTRPDEVARVDAAPAALAESNQLAKAST